MPLRRSWEATRLIPENPDVPKIIPPQVLLDAYSQGIFPMAEDGEIHWFSPLRRGLIPLDDRFHIPHGLAKSLARKPFEIRHNTAFREVMMACAARPETWIDDLLINSYCHLHELGHAHSFECWDDDGLQGGLYGVSQGGAFFGESMFSKKTDASKIALVALVAWLRERSFGLLDTQWMTSHLKQFGGCEVSREDYLQLLGEALKDRPSASPRASSH